MTERRAGVSKMEAAVVNCVALPKIYSTLICFINCYKNRKWFVHSCETGVEGKLS